MLSPPAGKYEPKQYFGRKLVRFDCESGKDWVLFFSERTAATIRWDCYWLGCPPPLLRSPDWDHIFLAGLTRLRKSSSYKGERL